MIRRSHSLPGLVFGLLLTLLAGTGALLSLAPVQERVQAQPADTTVAALAASVAAAHPDIERLERRANGVFTASFPTPEGYATVQVDPASGADLGPWEAAGPMRWLRGLHRSLFLGETGRATVGIAAAAMAALSATGLWLLAGMLGGWRRLGRPVRGTGAARWHALAGRAAMPGLAVSALTGMWLSLASFGLVDDGSAQEPAFPEQVAATAAAPVETLAALRQQEAGALRRLTWPAAGDPTDVYGLQTVTGEGYVDQATGALLNWQDHSAARRLRDWVYLLHTGQGLWWFGLLLGASALAVPVLAATGGWIWWKGRRARPRIAGTVALREAGIVVLVGSAGGTTWAFAATLVRALVAVGAKVHLGAMNDVGPMPAARLLILLAATHGDGEAPPSAARFLSRIGRVRPVPVAILGFGDRGFPAFCGFAETVADHLTRAGWPERLPLSRIDRQSTRDFALWGQALGRTIGLDLALEHRVTPPPTLPLRLLDRQDFGREVDAPSAILRFGPAEGPRLPRFQAGDLLGILAPGCEAPRFYSLASSRRDGCAEIAVRRMPGGACSGHLHGLRPGDTVRAFIQPNPAFRVAKGRAPVILIAAGCGIGPMIGFLRQLRPGRRAELYFGLRDPGSDFLYRRETDALLAERRLSRRVLACSRGAGRRHVQDRLRENAEDLAHQIGAGAQVLVCGSAEMARGVAAAFTEILQPLGLTVGGLKAEGRYLEDVY